jgi:hypothetical protein
MPLANVKKLCGEAERREAFAVYDGDDKHQQHKGRDTPPGE